MESRSKVSDFQNRIYLDRISKSLRDLSSTITDAQLFVQQMVSLSTLLTSLERKLDKSYSTIDKNTQDPTYFIAAYFDTRNVSEALLVYRIVSCYRYVVVVLLLLRKQV